MGNFKISNTTTNTPVANMWGATWNIVDDAAAGNNGTSGSTWQLVFGSASTDMWLRSITNAGNWSDYAKFVTNKNYTDYTVTKTGSGASGSWGISVTGSSASCTGNAATATTLQTGRSLWGNNFTGAANVTGTLTVQANAGMVIQAQATPWPYIRFDTRASDSGASYETVTKDTWCQLYVQVPAKSGSTYYKTRFFFRQYSKTANTLTRLGYYEDYYLPETNDGRTTNAGFNILTSKDLSFSITGSSGSCTGNAATATALSNIVSDQSASNVSGALQAFWNAKKSTMPRNQLISFTSSHSGRAMHMGYFISGYDSSPYGGFFTAYYNTPYYSYAYNGTFNCIELVRNNGGSYGISVTGSSGSCSGNAATATTASACSGNSATASKMGEAASWLYFHRSNEVNFGGTYNSNANIYFGYRATDSRAKPTDYYFGSDNGTANLHCNRLFAVSATDAAGNAANAVALVVGGIQTSAHIEMDSNEIIAKSNGTTKVSLWFNDSAEVTADGKVKNAVWNDYAEYRQTDIIDPGYCVATQEDGTMHITNSHMHPGARIVSDTFGHAIGMSDTAKTPIAVAGRVLVYPYQNRNNYHIGDCVCATYDGKVDIMTREEIKEYPDRIIGIVDEIPSYEYWEQSYTFYKTKEKIKSQIKVNGRIWIYVK